MATAVDEQPLERRPPSDRPSQADRPRAKRPRPAPLLVRLCVAVVLPIVASTIMALHNGWTPVGDNATLTLRAHDVLHGDPPLTGMPSTADTISDEKELDHPGPLQVWTAAFPVAILGPIGLLLTAAAVNAAALIVSVVIGWRRGGPPLAVAVTASGLLLCWSLGTTVIRDPLNSHVQLLSWFALVLLCWDVRLGRWRSLPVAVAFGSWVAQAHVVYVPMVLLLGIGTAVLCWADSRRRSDEERRRARRGRKPALIWSTLLGILLSFPMLVDQVSGTGNLGRMLGFSGRDGQGLATGLRTLIGALGVPPSWLRPINDPFVLLRGPSLLDLVGFAITVALLAWTLARAAARKDRTALALTHAVLLSLAGAVLVVVRTPVGGAVLAADPMLLWRPVTALVWLAITWGLWHEVADRVQPKLQQPVARTATAAIASVAALAVVGVTVFAPAKFGGYGEALMAPIARLEPKVLKSVDGQRMVQVNAEGVAAQNYLRGSVIATLEREGIPTRTGEVNRAFRRSGDDRAQPTATIWVITDPVEPKSPDPGAILVARTDLIPGGPLSPAAQRRRELRDRLDQTGRVQLRSTSRISLDDIRREFFRWDDRKPNDDDSLPSSWLAEDSFVDLARNGLVESPTVDRALVDQIHDDAIGRFFAAEDTELAIYVRFE